MGGDDCLKSSAKAASFVAWFVRGVTLDSKSRSSPNLFEKLLKPVKKAEHLLIANLHVWSLMANLSPIKNDLPLPEHIDHKPDALNLAI